MKSLIDCWPLAVRKVGWSAIPHIILLEQRALRLSPLDVNILLRLWVHWRLGGKVHPSKETIAADIGVKGRTVQRRIALMEKHGLIRREQRRTPVGSDHNLYHLDPLIIAAEPLALAELARRAQSKRPPRRQEFKPSFVIDGGKGQQGGVHAQT